MQHALQTEGFGVRLRPVRMTDAAFIVWLRNSDHVKGKVGDSAADVASQEAWLEAYFGRKNDYYFIAETLGGIPVGTYGIYGVRRTSAELGRHIIRLDVLAGVPTAVLATDLAFDRLGLSELRTNVVSTNRPILSVHQKSGYKQVGTLHAALTIGGKPVDLVQFHLKAEDWARVRERLLPLARLAGSHVLDWERTQGPCAVCKMGLEVRYSHFLFCWEQSFLQPVWRMG